MEEKAPWTAIKTDPDSAAVTLRTAMNLIYLFGIVSAPIVPDTAERIRSAFDVADDRRWVNGDELRALRFVPPGTTFTTPPVLFSKIDDDALADFRTGSGRRPQGVRWSERVQNTTVKAHTDPDGDHEHGQTDVDKRAHTESLGHRQRGPPRRGRLPVVNQFGHEQPHQGAHDHTDERDREQSDDGPDNGHSCDHGRHPRPRAMRRGTSTPDTKLAASKADSTIIVTIPTGPKPTTNPYSSAATQMTTMPGRTGTIVPTRPTTISTATTNVQPPSPTAHPDHGPETTATSLRTR